MMRKTAIIVLLVLMLGAASVYAGSGDLIVNHRLGIGTSNPGSEVDVAGNVNVTGSYKINGVALSLPGVLTGAACGLRIANDATSPTTKIDVTANIIGTVVPSGTIVINCSTSGQATGNDLDTGTRQASKWYYIWVIYNGTTLAGLASLSSTSPVTPGGYTYKSLVGVAVTDSSAHFLPMHQLGNQVFYDARHSIATGSHTSYTSLSLSSLVPPNAVAVTFGNAGLGSAQNSTFSTDGVNDFISETNVGGMFIIPLITPQTVYYKDTEALTFYILGFLLNL